MRKKLKVSEQVELWDEIQETEGELSKLKGQICFLSQSHEEVMRERRFELSYENRERCQQHHESEIRSIERKIELLEERLQYFRSQLNGAKEKQDEKAE